MQEKGREGGTGSVATIGKVGRLGLDNLAATPIGWYGRCCVEGDSKGKT